jgi:hypothetical protein
MGECGSLTFVRNQRRSLFPGGGVAQLLREVEQDAEVLLLAQTGRGPDPLVLQARQALAHGTEGRQQRASENAVRAGERENEHHLC